MKKAQLFKLLSAIIINYLILGSIIFAFSSRYNYKLNDSAFVIGLLALILGISFKIIGNPMELSIQPIENINSQDVSKIDLIDKEHENSKDKITLSFRDIITGVIIISSLLILITSFFL